MALLLPGFALALHFQMLHAFSIWLGWLEPSVFGCLATCLIVLLEQARVRNQRNRVLGNLKSYLPSDVAQQIAFSLPNSSVQTARRNVTLLSADLRNFSAFSESRPPEESAAVLHFFFLKATEIIESNGGRLHEFKGDGLLAIWDDNSAESVESAYRAAQAMHDRLNQQLLKAFAPEGLEALAVGVAIEQGPALIGSIGPAHRRAHTLLGDTVTIVLRMQEMTADLAQPILLGDCAARQLTSVKLQSQGSYLLSGLINPHVLYAPAPPNLSEISTDDAPRLTVVHGGRA